MPMKPLRTTTAVFIFMFLAMPHVFAQEESSQWWTEPIEDKIQRLSYNREYDRALVVAKKALEAIEQKVGRDHPDVAPMLETIAELYYHQEQYFDVELPLKRALAIREKTLGSDHLDIVETLNKLAEIYKTLGQYSKAEQLYLRIITIQEREIETDNPLFASSLNNLAELYSIQEKYVQAEELFKRALEILEATLDDLSHMIRTPLTTDNFENLKECVKAYTESYAKAYLFLYAKIT